MLFSRHAALVVILVAVTGAAVYFFSAHSDDIPDDSGVLEWQRPSGRRAGFRELAREIGLDFHMSFLPEEQGDNYNINPYDHGAGVAVADYDGDGRDDIYLVNQLGENALYRNNGDGSFSNVTEAAGVGLGDRVCVAATFADYDNSGRQALFVTSTRGGNVFFQNLGNGKFKDVTAEAGLSSVGHCQAATFFDYDNDGFLDLLVAGTAAWTRRQFNPVRGYYPGVASFWELARCRKEKNILYHNEPLDPADPAKGRKFVNVTDSMGLAGKGWSADIAVFDFDEDGYLDVVVTNMFGPAQLYHNNRGHGFSEVTDKTLGRTSWGGMGCRVFDSNNDGKLDLYIVDMHSDMWLPSRDEPTFAAFARKNQHVRYPDSSGGARAFPRLVGNVDEQERAIAKALDIRYDQVRFGNTFFKNMGGGKFEERAERAGLETFWPWGIATGDFDNDGYEDAFLPSGMGYPFFYWPNMLLMNNGDETFTDHARGEEIEPPARGIYQEAQIAGKRAARSSRAAAVADFSGSGSLDIVVNNFNDHPYFFRNQFPKQNFVEFRLQGTKSNRDAVGAIIRLYTGKEVLTRQVHGAGGYLAQSSKIVHFGLGERSTIEHVDIRWPSGIRTVHHPKLNMRHEIVEPHLDGPRS